MAQGKKTVKKRLMINSGIEMYRHRIAGAFIVLIPKTLYDLSDVLMHEKINGLQVILTVRYVIGRYSAARMPKKRE